MRKWYRYFCLPVLLAIVAVYGGGSALAEEVGTGKLSGAGVGTPSSAGIGTLIDAGIGTLTGAGVGTLTGAGVGTLTGAGVSTPSGAEISTPSDAETSTPSDADTSTPSDAVPDEFVLLMDIPSEGCRTQEELVERLLDDSSDRIVLASDIEWLGYDQIIVTTEKEVQMGAYKIRVGAEGEFLVNGPVAFYGEGNHSLFEVQGLFYPKNGVEIHASGDDVVAVDILDGRWMAKFVEIYAEGRNARAVRMAGSLEKTVDTCHIEAVGEDAVGIEAEGDIRLFLSSVSGEKAAVSSVHGNVMVFGSRVSPRPEHARVLPALTIPDNRLEENGFCIETGSAPDSLREIIDGYDELKWCFFAEGESVRSVYLIPVSWSGIPTDFSVPGTAFVRCAPAGLPEWFPAELYELEIPVHTVSPDSPFIMDAEDAGSAALLRFFAPIRDAQEIRVEYSMDDRKSWRDSAELAGSFVTDTLASIEPLEENRDYWFRVVVTGGPMEGISNEILFVGDEVRKANGGGDRDHGDRDDQGEEPPEGDIIPPPDTEGPDTERPGTEGPDAEEPDTEGPDAEEPGTEGPDTEGSGTEGPDAEGPGTEGPDAEEPDAEGSDAEGPGTEGPDAEEPDTEGPDAEGPGTEVPDTEGPDAEVPDTEGSDAEESDAETPGAHGSGTAGPDAVKPGLAEQPSIPEDKEHDFPQPRAAAAPADPQPHPSEIVTTPPDHISETSGEVTAAMSQKPSRFPRNGFLAVLIPGVFVLGGGVYVCWKKRRGKQ